MNPEAQRIAIAEACGAKRRLWYSASHWFLSFDESLPVAIESWSDTEAPRKHWLHTLPDYLNDLNAMYEAEKMIPKDKRQLYINYLAALIAMDYFLITHASASQRAEAFLRTIGKYE